MSTSEEETRLKQIFLPYIPKLFLKTAYGEESTQASHPDFQISRFRLCARRPGPKMGLNLGKTFLSGLAQLERGGHSLPGRRWVQTLWDGNGGSGGLAWAEFSWASAPGLSLI